MELKSQTLNGLLLNQGNMNCPQVFDFEIVLKILENYVN